MKTETMEKTRVVVDKKLIKVLLVEDNEHSIGRIKQALAGCSLPFEFAIEPAVTLSAAVEHLGAGNYDIVLLVLDLRLLDGDGIQTVQRLKEANPQIPVLALSGLDDDKIGLLAMRIIAEDYLSKSISLDNSSGRAIPYTLEGKKALVKSEEPPSMDTTQLIHELQVHQFELEMQNEELRRAQLELEESRGKYLSLFDLAPIGYFTLDEKGLIQEANLAGMELLGVDRRCLAERLSHFITFDCQDVFYLHREEVLKTNKKQICELKLKRKDGSEFYAELVSIPCQRPEGNLSQFRTAVTDITERKKAKETLREVHEELERRFEERTAEVSKANKLLKKEITEHKKAADALRDSEANFRRVIVASPNGIVIVDKNGIVRFVNPAVESLFGRQAEEIRGETFGFPIGLDKTAEIDVIHRTEGAIIAEMRMVEIDWEGETAYLASLHDITERKRAEEKLREVIDMRSAFVSMASHELRTPLTAIKEGIRLVIQEQIGKLNGEQKEFLGIAQRNVDRLARLINDILDFQKLESGRMDLDVQENDINEIVRETVETMTSVANEKGLNLKARLGDIMPKVKCDRDKITQVLANIVNNAIKFTKRGSVIITTTADDNIAQVSVSDTGPGIKKEDLPRLFNEFEQLASRGDRKTGGSGLGLAISRKIMEKHNGKIWAESERGKGTTFHFVVPIEERRSKGG